MFSAFLAFFLATPFVFGVGRTFGGWKYRFWALADLLALGVVLVGALALNLMVAVMYGSAGFRTPPSRFEASLRRLRGNRLASRYRPRLPCSACSKLIPLPKPAAGA